MKELIQRSIFGLLYVFLILLLVYYNFSPILFSLFGSLAMLELGKILFLKRNAIQLWLLSFWIAFLPWFSTVFVNTFFFEKPFFNFYTEWLTLFKIADRIVAFFEWRWLWILGVFLATVVLFYRKGGYKSLLPFAYIIMPFVLAIEIDIADQQLAISPILLIFIFMWTFDTFSYIFGKLFGRHVIAPSISPGKTWEGFAGGIAGAAVLTFFLSRSEILPFSHAISGYLLALVLVLSAFLGDLFESKLKRKAGVKDSGAFIPGHGGILDRIDSFLFAAPAFYFVYPLLLNL
ncbi:phosphatidate cytidylyltransferase [Thermaurantimonas aggregans]|uniref:Phosphatidate cytidylyltransferase n=1 Tax=Thermaurantimonas aggregans TaxID=2173829 RepID=A0A401XJB5_9FLAO|nr:phosphatidate cytidylyltransferase [Thermaurantimonas aggregans]MCX8148655.1 phosphatidate cytidylyltransferase [Thermaurantimonas aggregans]GCD77119.1 phosphatidate cytidylyltransferase [Thermaurantimonas aggregans]